MKELFLGLVAFCLLVSCNSNIKKENDVEKIQANDLSESSATKFQSFNEYSVYFHGLFDNNLGECSIDQYGNISIDNGSASAGRVSFRIIDVEISKEERPEEPGCADVCPPRTIISFDCKGGGDCVSDPGMGYKNKGGVLVYSVERGKMVYDFLIDFKKFVKNNI
ncbi:MAG: hypothetical protein ACPGLV_12770 [Bacteroidia bacterium]